MGNSTAGFVSTLEKSNDEGVKEVAAEKLCTKVKQFTQHGSYMKAVTKNAGKPLIGMLQGGTQKGKNGAAATLSYLALDAECKEQLAVLGAIPALVQLSKEGTPELQGAAAAALANMVSRSPANQAGLAEAGAIPPLVDIVKSGLNEARGWAASALGNLVLQHKKNQLRVAEAGAIPVLVELATPQASLTAPSSSSSGFDLLGLLTCRKRDDPKLQQVSKNMEMAARALSSLAFDCIENQEAIAKAGGVEVLLTLAKEGSQRDEVEAFRALALVWGKDEKGQTKDKILAAGGQKVCIEVVRNGHDDSKASAASMLARLAHSDAGIKESIATSGGIPPLVELGNTGAAQAKLSAVKALKELSTNCPENERLIEEAGGTMLLESHRSGMKFRELSADDEQRLQDVQARANAMKTDNADHDRAADPAAVELQQAWSIQNPDPDKPLCFK